jgi:(2R)-3-sulfolactate dehydrogenase (NADP+)
MIEILAAAVTGSAFGWEASSFFDAEGGPPNMGHVLIALDAERLSAGAYDKRMATLLAALRAARNVEPRSEYGGTRAVYDLSGQGLPFSRFAIEQVDKRWYVAE